jgi:hypothetical protein
MTEKEHFVEPKILFLVSLVTLMLVFSGISSYLSNTLTFDASVTTYFSTNNSHYYSHNLAMCTLYSQRWLCTLSPQPDPTGL